MEQSIEQIVEEYRASIFKLCLGYSKNTEDAKDLLQEVLINIWKGLKSFRADSNIKTWIYRITVNTCLLSLRRKSLFTISLNTVDESWLPIEVQKNIHSEPLQKLHELIQKLPEQEKLIILLYLEDLSHKEIAKVVGISSNYVGVKINRIKQNLTNKIKSHG